jgi:hypothetical protein
MPTNQCVWRPALRLEDCQRQEAERPWPVKPNPEYTLAGVKAMPFVIAIGHPIQLVAQGKRLDIERSPAPQEVNLGGEQKNEYCFHTGNATWVLREKSTNQSLQSFW